MEEFFIAGQGWSGWLHIYPQDKVHQFRFVLHFIAGNDGEDMKVFRSVEDCEQWMDELDRDFDDFPFREETQEDYEEAKREAYGL